MLGLFTVPPSVKIKDREERALEAQLLNAHRDFFQGCGPMPDTVDMKEAQNVDMFVDQKDAKRMRELERQQERREKHLLQMDATKKMYIDQIL